MKVLIFTAFYHPAKGGYIESTHGLSTRLLKRGSIVTVLTCNTENASVREMIDGVEVIRIPCWNPKWLNSTFPIPKPFSLFRIIQELYKRQFDIISTQTRFFITSLCGFIFAKLGKIPIVHTERGGVHTESQNLFVREAGKTIDHTVGFLIARFSDAVIGVSDAACVFMRHLGAKNPIRISNGIDVNFWQKPASTVKCCESIVITFVGRLIYGKGVQDLIRALHALNSQFSIRQLADNFQLNIIGDGAYRSNLEQLTRELNLKQVKFLGELNGEKIREMLWQTDIFVNPSYSEGLPRSVLEASAVGLPIIATDVGGTREIIINEKHGLLFQPKNIEELASKIEILLNDIKLREEMGRNAQEYVRINFDWNKIIEQYIEVFDRVINLKSQKSNLKNTSGKIKKI